MAASALSGRLSVYGPNVQHVLGVFDVHNDGRLRMDLNKQAGPLPVPASLAEAAAINPEADVFRRATIDDGRVIARFSGRAGGLEIVRRSRLPRVCGGCSLACAHGRAEVWSIGCVGASPARGRSGPASLRNRVSSHRFQRELVLSACRVERGLATAPPSFNDPERHETFEVRTRTEIANDTKAISNRPYSSRHLTHVATASRRKSASEFCFGEPVVPQSFLSASHANPDEFPTPLSRAPAAPPCSGRQVYGRYNPKKVSRVEELLRQYQGREADLVGYLQHHRSYADSEYHDDRAHTYTHTRPLLLRSLS